MKNANSGYKGYSMSKRAVDAYEKGEQPESYWTKRVLFDAVEETNPSILAACRSLCASELRDFLLEYKGWHHTSSFLTRPTSMRSGRISLIWSRKMFRNTKEEKRSRLSASVGASPIWNGAVPKNIRKPQRRCWKMSSSRNAALSTLYSTNTRGK